MGLFQGAGYGDGYCPSSTTSETFHALSDRQLQLTALVLQLLVQPTQLMASEQNISPLELETSCTQLQPEFPPQVYSQV